MLEITWFYIWVLLWAIYLVLDGFDFGLGTLLPFVAKNNTEKRVIYNAAGPYWDANEVWLVTAGGVTFAAFPKVYAVMFSALYAPLLLLLFCLIFRAVAFEFRAKLEGSLWKGIWDCTLFLTNLLPALLLGVFFSNLFMGIPIDADGVYHGNLLKLLSPFALIGGVLFVLSFTIHGGLWLAIKSSGELQERTLNIAKKLWFVTLVVLGAYLVYSFFVTPIWNDVFSKPWVIALLLITALCFVFLYRFLEKGNYIKAFIASSAYILFMVFFAMSGMFPTMLLSSIDPNATLTAYNSSASQLTMKIMLIVCLCSVPVVILYQAWVHYIFRGEVTQKDLDSEHSY